MGEILRKEKNKRRRNSSALPAPFDISLSSADPINRSGVKSADKAGRRADRRPRFTSSLSFPPYRQGSGGRKTDFYLGRGPTDLRTQQLLTQNQSAAARSGAGTADERTEEKSPRLAGNLNEDVSQSEGREGAKFSSTLFYGSFAFWQLIIRTRSRSVIKGGQA